MERTHESLKELEGVTVAEVAVVLEVSITTVRRWIHDGLLPAFRVGTTTRVLVVDLKAFIERHRNTSPPADDAPKLRAVE